ncbi:MAG TPA: hypothetical protein DCR46_07470 [Cytophagales bacterium]|nr:hypothetical protein [Cytophagales bacterium]
MQSFHITLQYSAWWLFVIIPTSAALAWLLYSGKSIWENKMRMFLMGLRFMAVFLLLFLLLNPHITFIKSFKEKPLFPIVVDNSQSVLLAVKNENSLKEAILAIQNKLQKLGFESPIYIHDEKLDQNGQYSFQHPTSDLTKLLTQAEKSSSSKKSKNLLLLSDGIFNSGISPAYQPFHSKIITLGLGDTVPRKDLALKSLQNNSVAFLGNKFPLVADVQAIGYANKEIEVVLKDAKGIVERKKMTVERDFWIGKANFVIATNTPGFQRYTVEVTPAKGESNLLNNKLNTYVDIVNDREKILLISPAPHPNIKAIRAALAKSENIQLELLIPDISEAKEDVYDMVILHNCLLSTFSEAQKYIKENTPVLYVVGADANYPRFNAENELIEVLPNSTDQVNAMPNPLFSRFKMNENSASILEKLPPIEVPFGEIKIKPGTEIALFQKINGISSAKPLLIFGNGRRNNGVLLTNGLWQWRMYEKLETGKSETVDELVTKTVQYLSSKDDKRKFRIYPHQREYNEEEIPRIESELYNNLYEKVFGQKISVRVVGNQAKSTMYEFTPLEGNASLALPLLAPGVYKVEAQTSYAGKQFNAYTEFVVKERQLEALDLRANHQVLRDISHKSGGKFFPWHQKDTFMKSLDTFEAKAIWKSEEKKRNLIDEKWYFFLILTFLATEWVIRRYTGGY